jgi:hypothetical protein
MKTRNSFRTVIILIAFFLPGFLMASPPENKQIRPVGSFNAVKVSAGIDVSLEAGAREKVEIEGDQKEMDEIITEVKDGTLHIYRKNKIGFNFDFHNDCEVHVTVKTLEALEASSGSEVKSKGILSGKGCRIDASSGSEVTLEMEYEKLSVDSSSGSEIHLQGKTNELSVSVSSGSEIKACGLSAGIVHADASSGGGACVKVSSELHANASSGGDIEYEGAPGTLDVHKSSGGRVSKN